MSGIPAELRDLIIQHFDSAEAIEITLLLRRSAPTFWSPAAVSQHVGISEDVAKLKLTALANAKILVPAQKTTAFRYAPADEALETRIGELAEIYANRRISVINTIHSANLDRLGTLSS